MSVLQTESAHAEKGIKKRGLTLTFLKKFFLSSTFDLDSEALLEAGSLKTVNKQGFNVFILSKHGEMMTTTCYLLRRGK